MFIISKRFHFSASHVLDSLPDVHQCSRMHGHNYIVEIVLQSETVDEHGFVVDYLQLQPFKAYLDNELDHRHLNDVLPFSPTAENLAWHLYKLAKQHWWQVTAVRVSETPNTWAEYREA